MQLDLNQKETQILIYALRMYEAHIRTENAELIKFDKTKMKYRYYNDEDMCSELRGKLKQLAMQFPCEDHKDYADYSLQAYTGRTTKELFMEKMKNYLAYEDYLKGENFGKV